MKKCFVLLLSLFAFSSLAISAQDSPNHFGVIVGRQFDTVETPPSSDLSSIGGLYSHDLTPHFGVMADAYKNLGNSRAWFGTLSGALKLGPLFVPVGIEYAYDDSDTYASIGLGLEAWTSHVGLQVLPRYHRLIHDLQSSEGDFWTLHLGILLR